MTGTLPRIPDDHWTGFMRRGLVRYGACCTVLSLLLFTIGSSPRPVHAVARLATQRALLCSASTISPLVFGRLQVALTERLGVYPAITRVRVARASSRCLQVILTARGQQRAAIVGAGKIGALVVAASKHETLQPGTPVRLVCPQPHCSPGVRTGIGRPGAHPPILAIILAEGHARPMTAAAILPTGTYPFAHAMYRLRPQAARRWCRYTGSHIEQSFAIVADSVVVAAPFIYGGICTGVMFVPTVSLQEAYRVAGYVRSGPLPVRLQFTAWRTG